MGSSFLSLSGSRTAKAFVDLPWIKKISLLVGFEATEYLSNCLHGLAQIAMSTHKVQLGLEAALNSLAKPVDYLYVIVGQLSIRFGRPASSVKCGILGFKRVN